MQQRKRVFDLSVVLSATMQTQSCLRTYTRVVNDPQITDRLNAQQCRICFYNNGRIGGAACTSVECGGCTTILHSGNTCTDVLCLPCAQKYDVCRHCGAAMDEKMRRKLERK